MSLFGWLQLATVPWMAVLCVKDWRTRRLPDVWVLPMAVVALLCRTVLGGWSAGLGDGLLGGLVCGAFLIVPFLAHRAGAGDVKLLFVCGCWVGLGSTLMLLVLTSLAGFGSAVLLLCCSTVSRSALMHRLRSRFGRKQTAAQAPDPEAGGVPFATAIAVGFYGTVLLEGGLL